MTTSGPPGQLLYTAYLSGSAATRNARLDDDLADLLEQRAESEGVHKSDAVREALGAYLI